MSIAFATSLASDMFRISYQNIESGFQQPLPASPTLAEEIGQGMRTNIALLDTIFSIGQYFNKDLENICLPIISVFRMTAVVQGMYLIETDPNADTKSILLDCIPHLLHINRFGLKIISQIVANPVAQDVLNKASLALLVLDAGFRVFSLISNRIAISDKVKELYQQVRQGDYASLISGPSYVLRTTIVAFAAIIEFVLGYLALTIPIFVVWNLDYKKTKHFELGIVTGATVALAGLISLAVDHIFDEMGFQQTKSVLSLLQHAFSLITAATLIAALRVGLGHALSFSDSLKTTFPPILTIGLLYSLYFLFVRAFSKLADKPGLQDLFDRLDHVLGNQHSKLVLVTISALITSFALTTFASVGFGLSKTVDDALIMLTLIVIDGGFLLSFGLIAIAGTSVLSASLKLAGRVTLFGIPSWDEIRKHRPFILPW